MKKQGLSFERMHSRYTSKVTLTLLVLAFLTMIAWMGIYALDTWAMTISAVETDRSWICDRIPEQCARSYWWEYCTSNPDKCK